MFTLYLMFYNQLDEPRVQVSGENHQKNVVYSIL